MGICPKLWNKCIYHLHINNGKRNSDFCSTRSVAESLSWTISHSYPENNWTAICKCFFRYLFLFKMVFCTYFYSHLSPLLSVSIATSFIGRLTPSFFSGFQHNAFVTFSLCALAVLLVSLQGDDQLSTKKSLLPTALLILPVALFFGNQSGFRAYDTFEPIKTGLEKAAQFRNERELFDRW